MLADTLVGLSAGDDGQLCFLKIWHFAGPACSFKAKTLARGFGWDPSKAAMSAQGRNQALPGAARATTATVATAATAIATTATAPASAAATTEAVIPRGESASADQHLYFATSSGGEQTNVELWDRRRQETLHWQEWWPDLAECSLMAQIFAVAPSPDSSSSRSPPDPPHSTSSATAAPSRASASLGSATPTTAIATAAAAATTTATASTAARQEPSTLAKLAHSKPNSIAPFIGFLLDRAWAVITARPDRVTAPTPHGKPLTEAVRYGFRGIALLLRERGASLGPKVAEELLYEAAREGRMATIQLMLFDRSGAPSAEPWASVNSKPLRHGGTAVDVADSKGHRACVALLRAAGGRLSLHRASTLRHEEDISAWLQEGADVDECDSSGATPLWLVVRGRRQADGQSTLEAQGQGRTPSIDCIQRLLQAKATVDALPISLETPLAVAASSGDVEHCRLLLAARASLESRDREGRTPLQRATPAVAEVLRRHSPCQNLVGEARRQPCPTERKSVQNHKVGMMHQNQNFGGYPGPQSMWGPIMPMQPAPLTMPMQMQGMTIPMHPMVMPGTMPESGVGSGYVNRPTWGRQPYHGGGW
eukprot:CAMPEP_0206506438 /NCGR_PEP_ID=MMETSP0324_2-20121206/56766_1 /ASSEMBLY_ACC=CAM_ASM_000836 /TAXON_ID=2866 /ORGANISM="Crypthecodinium cohnii, Strain Seligo" /LENGTH=594 /DNA_ID=CAMNT_0053996169 /DNA_START=171 /DNA_END=1952 /DNA_ORIENTATION=+